MNNLPIVLCCSFSPLTIDYDYIGLTTFNQLIDECVFFCNKKRRDKVDTSLINSRITCPIKWVNYTFTNFSRMRNDLISHCKGKWVLMIDDTYLINYSINKEQLKSKLVGVDAATFYNKTLESPVVKLFLADKFFYVLSHNEIIVCREKSQKVVALDIELLDLPDMEKSRCRALRAIQWLNEDLLKWKHDLFIRTHILYYIGVANELLENWNAASYYFKLIIDSEYVPRDSWFYHNSRKKYQKYQEYQA